MDLIMKLSNYIGLPLTHITTWSCFQKIISSGLLKTNYCNVFKDDILYLSYGKVVYEASLKPNGWSEDFPVVFIFTPHLSNYISKYYPFDSGALAAGHLKEMELLSKSDFRKIYNLLNDKYPNPANWLNMLFGSYENYYSIDVKNLSLKEESFSEKTEILKYIYSKNHDIDQRYTTIECHINHPIKIDSCLLKIGVPIEYCDNAKQFAISRNIPKSALFFYENHSINGRIPEDLKHSTETIIRNYNLAQQKMMSRKCLH